MQPVTDWYDEPEEGGLRRLLASAASLPARLGPRLRPAMAALGGRLAHVWTAARTRLPARLGKVRPAQLIGAPLRHHAQPPLRITFPAPRMVLPPILRKPARWLSRVDLPVPRRPMLKLSALLFLATGLYGVAAGGHTEALVGSLSEQVGLGISAVKITGQSQTSEVDMLDRLAIPEDASMVAFDAEAARQRLETLPWIEKASIRKLYPGTLQVTVTERTPFALWQHGGTLSLVDGTGKVISDYVDPIYAGLPMVVGADAAPQAKEITGLIGAFPALRPRVKAAVLVSGRRWNIVLANNVTIMLPETGARDALQRIVDFDAANGLLSRDIAAVDLRVADKFVVRLTDEGDARLKAAIKEREKTVRRRGAAA